MALVLGSGTASASTIDIRCPRLPDAAKGELEARARLFFTSAGMESASVSVQCDDNAAWLVWVDGSTTPIDANSSIVEGALDAIEDRIAQSKRGAAGQGTAPPPAPPSSEPIQNSEMTQGKGPAPDAPPGESAESSAIFAKQPPGSDLEGGVGLALLTEFWSGALSAGMGPRLDVGVGVGRKLAIVVSEGARFAVGSGLQQMMAFDLQVGVAYGAPYQTRTGFGVVLLGGAERLAASYGGGTGGLQTWSATGSLGLRGSLAAGPLDAWIGVDGMLRSTTIETGGPHPSSVPSASVLLSLGCFLPAFAGTQGEEAKPQQIARRTP